MLLMHNVYFIVENQLQNSIVFRFASIVLVWNSYNSPSVIMELSNCEGNGVSCFKKGKCVYIKNVSSSTSHKNSETPGF